MLMKETAATNKYTELILLSRASLTLPTPAARRLTATAGQKEGW
jgi:hypothetical protein